MLRPESPSAKLQTMHNAFDVDAPNGELSFAATFRACIPAFPEASVVIASALLIILSFPNFELWPLAWVGLVPLLLSAARPLRAGRAFLLGWLWGAVFFYGTCWWL